MINVLAYSAGRSDQDRWIPFLESLEKNQNFNLFLILGSTHFNEKFGNSYKTFKKNMDLQMLDIGQQLKKSGRNEVCVLGRLSES